MSDPRHPRPVPANYVTTRELATYTGLAYHTALRHLTWPGYIVQKHDVLRAALRRFGPFWALDVRAAPLLARQIIMWGKGGDPPRLLAMSCMTPDSVKRLVRFPLRMDVAEREQQVTR